MAAGLTASEKRARASLVVLTAIYTFNFMDRQILSVLAEPIKMELGLSDTQLGMLTGFLFAAFYTCVGLPVSWLADRISRVRILAVACTTWSLCCAACGFAGSFGQLALARIGVGIGEAGGVPPSYAIISDLFPKEHRARALAVYSLGVPFGLAIGASLAGWIAAEHGWRTSLLVVGLSGLPLVALLLLVVREPRRGAHDGPAVASNATVRESMHLFFETPRLILVASACAIGAVGNCGLMAWLSAYLIRVEGMRLQEVATYLSLTIACAMGVGTWTSGVLSDKFGARDGRAYPWIACGAMLSAVPLLVCGLSVQGWHLAMPLLGMALGCSSAYLAPAITFVQNNVPSTQRSFASALQLFLVNMIGLGGGPVYVGWVSDHLQADLGDFSLRIGLMALVPFFLSAAALNLVAARVIGREQQAERAVPA